LENESGIGSAQKEGKVAQIMYTHVSKYKNNKNKNIDIVHYEFSERRYLPKQRLWDKSL
jgi:hypothetical protein